MKAMKNKKFLLLFFIICMNFSMLIASTYETPSVNQDDNDLSSLKTSAVESGGKLYTTRTTSIQNCYINNKLLGLNRLPNIYIKNNILSNAEMTFDDIIVHNFTYDLEPDFTEAFKSKSSFEPTYIYQKFWVDKSTFLYNVSIYILDEINELLYDETNSWEVAIMNCTNDFYGTPFDNGTIQIPLEKTHRRHSLPDWELFDFLNSPIGSLFLDIDNTNYTVENGLVKYWFAIRVKMPPDDTYRGGGRKFLFFKPDGTDPNDKGAGDTFARFGQSFGTGAHRKIFSENYVGANNTNDGTVISGDLISFNETDSDRFLAQSDTNNLTITTRVDFKIEDGYWFWLINKVLPSKTPEELLKEYNIPIPWEEFWNLIHPYLIYGFEINVVTNISDIGAIQTANMFVYNASNSEWFNVTNDFNITQVDETLLNVRISELGGKEGFLSLLGTPLSPYNYNLTMKFNYTSSAGFNVSFNEVTVDVVRLEEISPLQRFDPGISDLFYPIKATVNSTTGRLIGDPNLNVLELNDGKYFKAQSWTNNLTIDFEFNLLPYLNNSLWSMDELDYQYIFPNPIIPNMLLALTSNVSIDNANNLSLAKLYVNVKDSNLPFLPEGAEWLPIWEEELLAHKDEFQVPAKINSSDSWFILQMINSSSQENSLKFRLRYEWNESQTPPPGGFNVTIDEFSFDITIQNAVSSDITSMIGIGLNNSDFQPPDINLKVQSIDVANDSTWEAPIVDGIPSSDGYFEFNISTNWESISFNVTVTYTTYKYIVDLDFEKKIESQYMKGTNYFSVEVTDDSGNELEDITLTFELLDSNGKVVDEDTSDTNDEGVAKGSLNFKEVGDGYTVKVSFDEDSIYAKEDIESDEFRIVDETILLIDNFLFFLPYILIAVAVTTIFVTVRHHKMNKLRRYWAEDALILDDLLKISYIMIIHKDAGVTIYSKQISMELDSDLIGGFLTAISAFRSEIKKPKDQLTKSKGFEMDYYDFKIIINDGDVVRVALILDGIPSDKLEENHEAFTSKFEQRFRKQLDPFTGDVKPFVATESIIERYFNLSLMYPLQLGKHWEFIKFKKLENALVEVAVEMQKERKFFFFSSLLSYGLAGRKASRDQIISTILELKRRGIIVPIEME